MKRNLEIDRLRSIASLVVVFCHLMLIYNPGMLPFEHGFATTIIDLTFAISGFVISSILVEQVDRLKGNNVQLIAYLKAFLIRRIFRIYPPLWSVFFLVLFFTIFFNNSGVFSTIHNVLITSLLLLTSTYNFFFMGNTTLALAPYWSLTIEEQFYLVFPVFLLLTKDNAQRTKIFIFLILLITFVFRPLTIHYYDFRGLYFTQTRCDAMMYGCLIYILTQQQWFNYLKPAGTGNRWLRMAFVSVLLYVIIGITSLGISPIIFLPINCLLVSVLLICAVFEKNIIAFPSIIQIPLDIIAPRSYGLYIIHMPIILFTNEIFFKYTDTTNLFLVLKTIFTLSLIMFANEVLYRFILKPSLDKGKIISHNIIERAATRIG